MQKQWLGGEKRIAEWWKRETIKNQRPTAFGGKSSGKSRIRRLRISPQAREQCEAVVQLPDDYGWPVKGILAALIVLSLFMAGWHCTQARIDPDELEHLHAAWLWSQGVEPYSGFFENHPPAYWMLLRPWVDSLQTKDLETLVTRCRLFSWVIVTGTILGAWWFFAALFGRKAAWCGVSYFAVYRALATVTFEIRPEMLSLMLWVFGGTLAINGFGLGRYSKGVSLWRLLGGGVLMGASACVLTKSTFLTLALAAVLAFFAVFQAACRKNRTGLLPLTLVVAGLAIPLALQLAWVFLYNDFKAFTYCTVEVNSHYLGMALKNRTVFHDSWTRALGWPMVSVPLAVLGIGQMVIPWKPFGAAAKRRSSC